MLREKYKVFLFSGSTKNRIDYLDGKYGIRQDFDDCIFSYEVGLHKLEKEYYEQVPKIIGFNPEECLYIDDRQKCLDFAKPLGFNVLLFENIDKLEDNLKSFIKLNN